MDRYPMLPVAIALILGIILGDWIGLRFQPWVWGVDMVVMLVVFALFRLNRYLQTAVLLLGTLFCGIWLTVENERSNRVELPDHEVAYEAVVASEPTVHGKVLKCDLILTNLGQPLKVKASILRDTLHAPLQIGDGLVAHSVLEAPRNFYQDSHFDYQRWMKIHGYKAQTFIYKNNWMHQQVSLLPLSRFTRARLAAMQFRHTLIEKFKTMGLDDSQLALISAMALGEKSMISKQTKEDYSISGGSHILALSGLHLGIIYAILLYVVTLLMRYIPGSGYNSFFVRRCVTQVICLSSIWAYVFLVGMAPSVIRSATMLSLYGLVSILNQQRVSLNTLAVAAVIMLVINPLNLWDVGFQMSFMAVLGILLFVPRVKMNWLVGMVAVSVAAQIGVAPLIMYYFSRFSCYFILTNLIVIPCATVLLYGVIVLLVVTPLAAVQQFVAGMLSDIASWMNAGVGWVASLPGASIENINVSLLQVVCIYIFIFCVYQIICLTLHTK